MLFLVLLLSEVGLSVSSSPVYSCNAGPSVLTVNSDGSYAVSVGGSAWLSAGGLTVSANSSVFSTFAPVQDLCSLIPSIDCVGNDLENITTPSAVACCASCEALSACRAWSWDGGSRCYMKNGCSNPVNVPSVVSGVGVNHLAFSTSSPVNGTDAFGEYTGWSITWNAVTASGGVLASLITTNFLCYEATVGAGQLIAFEGVWNQGAESTNTTRPPSRGTPILQFPSFASTGALRDELRWLHVDGIWTLNEVWGTGVGDAGSSPLTSGTDSPLWLFNASAPGQGTLLLAPLDSFKAQWTSLVADLSGAPSRLVSGLYSTILNVPAGFASRQGIWASGSGVSAATLEWGATLTGAYNLQRIPPSRDVLNQKLSYWSDNGATLFQSYWDTHCPTRNCTAVSIPNGTNAEETFIALKAYHTAEALPASIYQLDTWWFPQGADYNKSGTLDCAEWVPRPDLFPHGLPYLTQQGDGGIPLLLYSWGFVPPSAGNTMLNYTWVDSYNGKEAMVQLDQVYSFYSMIRDRFLAYNGTSYEDDNTASWTNSWDQTQIGVDTASQWFYGFATPWCESYIPVQICEATAGDLMESLHYNCITSSRDTIDDVPGSHQSNPLTPDGSDVFFLHRWRVGQDRLLMGALSVRPFFDNVWSTMWQNASTWAGDAEFYVELAWILSTMTAGAVGFGDLPGNSNATLIMTACRSGGTLLTASLPSYYLDAIYLPNQTLPGLDPSISRIYQAPSFVPASTSAAAAAAAARSKAGNYDLSYFTYSTPSSSASSSSPLPPPYMTLLAIDVNQTITLQPSSLSPNLTPSQVNARASTSDGGAEAISGYLAVPWTAGFAALKTLCTDGAPTSQCATPFSPSAPLLIRTGAPTTNYTHDFELYSLSPIYANGFALLGELGKVIRVSTARVPWVSANTTNLSFQVEGDAGESVDIVVAAPSSTSGGILRVVSLEFPTASAFIVTCSGAGGASQCTSTPSTSIAV